MGLGPGWFGRPDLWGLNFGGRTNGTEGCGGGVFA
jgi:hypothetical protein